MSGENFVSLKYMSLYTFDHWKPFKTDEKCFLFHFKSSFFLKIFTFLFWIFGYVEKQLD